MYHIAILKGDGIGPEIVTAAMTVLDKAAKKFDFQLTYHEAAFGGAGYDKYGSPYPDETRQIVENCQAVLLGAVGGPQYDLLPREFRPESGLLAIRKELGLYCNIRSIKYYDFLANQVVWKEGFLNGVDIIIYRELTGGAYFGEKKRENDWAYDTIYYTKTEIERIVRQAFATASNRPRKLLHSIDKANVMESSRLWREVVENVAKDFPQVHVEHLYVDNAAMQLIVNPQQFDVIVTENMFGDILSDEAAALGGSLGMMASASLGGKISLYEPAHGSAPDIAGKDKANPIATILSAAMLLRFSFQEEAAAQAIEQAVTTILTEGYRTADIADDGMKSIGCLQMAQLIADRL